MTAPMNPLIYLRAGRSSPPLASRLRAWMFALPPSEAMLAVRGFASTTPAKRAQLERNGGTFISGFNAAIATADPVRTVLACDEHPAVVRGFSYEGAAMGMALLDLITVGVPRRWRAFAEHAGGAHIYMLHVGAGWALARCPWGLLTFWPKLDPVLRWLAIDGIGFHSGFFHPASVIGRQRAPWPRGRAPDVFDNGIGRVLWFVCGAEPELAVKTLTAFAPERRPALWSGLGLAAAYAGGASDGELAWLAAAAGEDRSRLAVGSAWAAGARQRAGNPADHTDRACRILSGLSALEAAALSDACREQIAADAPDAYRQWRGLVLATFQRSFGA